MDGSRSRARRHARAPRVQRAGLDPFRDTVALLSRIGVQLQPQHADYAALRAVVAEAEDLGVDIAFNWDHFYPLYGDPDGLALAHAGAAVCLFLEERFPETKAATDAARAAAAGLDPLPNYTPPCEAAPGDLEQAKRYPLALIAPAGPHFLNTEFSNLPALRDKAGPQRVLLHVEDAAARGLERAGAAQTRRTVDRGEVNAGGEPDAADVDDMGRALQRMHGIGEYGFERDRATTSRWIAEEHERPGRCLDVIIVDHPLPGPQRPE